MIFRLDRGLFCLILVFFVIVRFLFDLGHRCYLGALVHLDQVNTNGGTTSLGDSLNAEANDDPTISDQHDVFITINRGQANQRTILGRYVNRLDTQATTTLNWVLTSRRLLTKAVFTDDQYLAVLVQWSSANYVVFITKTDSTNTRSSTTSESKLRA